MSVITRVQNDLSNLIKRWDHLTHLKCEIDDGLGLNLGAVLLRIALEDRSLPLTRRGKRNRVEGSRPVQHRRDYPIPSLIDRTYSSLSPHRTIHPLHPHLPHVSRRL